MTWTDSIQTTMGGLIPEFRDRVTNMANWSLIEENINNGTADEYGDGDWCVIQTAHAEQFRLRYDWRSDHNDDHQYIRFDWGRNWDATNNYWGDSNHSDRYDQPSTGWSTWTLARNGRGDNLGWNPGDAATMWLYHADSDGFVWFFKRNTGDGYDRAGALGIAEVNKQWDYSLASEDETNYSLLLQGTHGYWNCLGRGGESSSSIEAQGQPNGDANYSNYPLTKDNIVASDQYQGTIVGTHNMWLKDTGNGTHGDVIQDSGGTTIYQLMQPLDNIPVVGVKQ